MNDPIESNEGALAGSAPVPCSPLTVDQVLVALRAMAAQEETTRRVLTGPRDAPNEFTTWYASQVLFEAARLIEANRGGVSRHDER